MDKPNLNPQKSSSNASKQLQNEDRNKALIIKALIKLNRPLSRWELFLITDINRETLCLPLLHMIKSGVLYYESKSPCRITGNKVFKYALSKWKKGGADA